MLINKSLDLFEKFIIFEKNLSPNTIKAYKNDILVFEYFLKKEKVNDTEEINYQFFKNFLKFLDRYNYSNRSIIRKLSTYINYFKFLEHNKFIKTQISQKISVPKRETRFYDFLSEEEMERFLESIPHDSETGKRDRLIFEIFYSTGVRISELENIKLKDIDIKNCEIKVFGKGRKERIVFLNNEANLCLNEYMKIRNYFLYNKKNNSYKKNEYLFLSKRGEKLSQRYIRRLLSKYLAVSDLKKHISPHALRHSFATHLLQEGANIRVVQELLGHSSLNSTQIYTHLNLKKMKEDFKKFHPRAK